MGLGNVNSKLLLVDVRKMANFCLITMHSAYKLYYVASDIVGLWGLHTTNPTFTTPWTANCGV